MPLAFESINYGSVAFGFFNIETDMLLLEHDFFFASDFCEGIKSLAESPPGFNNVTQWGVYKIPPSSIGDLHGAIAGIHFAGFIGEIYTHFPFPRQLEKFKQRPDGFLTRPLIERIVIKYATKETILFRVDEEKRQVEIGEYLFTFTGFHELTRYVWQGGYPRWKDGKRPEYVVKMKQAIETSQQTLFKGMRF